VTLQHHKYHWNDIVVMEFRTDVVIAMQGLHDFAMLPQWHLNDINNVIKSISGKKKKMQSYTRGIFHY
jgi:hypothetical protein